MKNTRILKLIIGSIVFSIISTSFIQAYPNSDNNEIQSLQFFSKQANDIDQNITNYMKELYMTSLSAGIIINNNLAWYKGYGYYRDYYKIVIPEEAKIPRKNTVYVVASVSKPITATAILQLYDAGKLDLDDCINNYLDFDIFSPFYPEINITIKMLLNHSGGFKGSDFIRYLSIIRNFMNNQNLYFNLLYNCKIDFIKNHVWREDYQPGRDNKYANLDYALLDYLVEIISGQSFEEYCKENIFDPLEMYNTSFNYPDFKRNQLAEQYLFVHDLGFYFKLPRYNFPLMGAGGLRTSVEDLSHFLIAHMNNGTYKNVKILENETINMMHKLDYYVTGVGKRIFTGFGLGWCIYNDSNFSGHDGDLPAGHARMKWNKTNDLGIIYFFNSDEIPCDTAKRIGILADLQKELLKNVDNLI
jgi:CubicO group peptidase (beta-lactamase class C family)